MASIKMIMLMCAMIPALATGMRLHSNCLSDIMLHKHALVVSMHHPHFQCDRQGTLIGEDNTMHVPAAWGVESFITGMDDAYDANGHSLPKMSYLHLRSKIIQKRKENGIQEPGRTSGAMENCSFYKHSYVFNVTGAGQDVYLCAPKSTGKMITIVNNCPVEVGVSLFGKKKKGNFVCSAFDSNNIQAGEMVQMPMRQFEKLYLTTDPSSGPYTPDAEKSVFFGKKEVAKMTLDQVVRGSHYDNDDDCNYPPGNTFAPIVSPSSKHAVYSLCRPIRMP
jgi:hypothetical protein